MGIKELDDNIKEEEKLVEELYKISKTFKKNKAQDIIDKHVDSLKTQINIVNNSIPHLIEEISLIKQLATEKSRETKLVKIDYNKPGLDGNSMSSVIVKEEDKNKFIKSAGIIDSAIKQIKKLFPQEDINETKTNFLVKISSRLFFETSNDIVKRGYFKKLNVDLRKANIKLLLNTYLSLMFFFILFSFFAGFIIFVFLIFFSISPDPPFLKAATAGIGMRILQSFWIIIFLPLFTFLIFYFYPGSEASSIGKKVDQELPFVVINMSAIASSEIEPSKIFQIIARTGDEYPYTKDELEKVINYINIYGYDTNTALRAVSEKTASEKLKELFDGMANSISSGTSLTNFLDKRAESLLFDYRLERESYTKLAETFMNIYISIVIAAPLVLMLTFFLMSLGGLGIGIGIEMISLLIVLVVIVINIFFLGFLHLKQPSY